MILMTKNLGRWVDRFQQKRGRNCAANKRRSVSCYFKLSQNEREYEMRISAENMRENMKENLR